MKIGEIELQALRLLENNPYLTQRELSSELGVSLGKAHNVLRGLIELGWVKLCSIKRDNHKRGVAYFLTSDGVSQKARMTKSFLDRKKTEYEKLGAEIARLNFELGQLEGL